MTPGGSGDVETSVLEVEAAFLAHPDIREAASYEAEVREDKKGSYYVAVIEKPGRDSADVVAEVVPEIAKTFPWQLLHLQA